MAYCGGSYLEADFSGYVIRVSAVLSPDMLLIQYYM